MSEDKAIRLAMIFTDGDEPERVRQDAVNELIQLRQRNEELEKRLNEHNAHVQHPMEMGKWVNQEDWNNLQQQLATLQAQHEGLQAWAGQARESLGMAYYVLEATGIYANEADAINAVLANPTGKGYAERIVKWKTLAEETVKLADGHWFDGAACAGNPISKAWLEALDALKEGEDA